MAKTYGVVKARVISEPRVKGSRHKQEIQYHLHVNLAVPDENGRTSTWDVAINVGTNDADDLLQYRMALDFHHPVIATLKESPNGFRELTGDDALPALDFMRSNVLDETGDWRKSDVMDGEPDREPYRSVARLLERARQSEADVYVFGRTYEGGDLGIHDVHMNQGSTSSAFRNNGTDDNDHNDVWQDGAVLVDFGQPEWAGYFTAFTQQLVPTDERGNPTTSAHAITDQDPGTEAAE